MNQVTFSIEPDRQPFSIHLCSAITVFAIDLNIPCMLIYACYTSGNEFFLQGGAVMATKTNFILKVQDAKLADVQKALKDANINVISILEIHKEEA